MPRTAVARALRKAGRSGCRPCRRQVGKATQPLGVVVDRFDGLAQGMKRAQAESGTTAEVPHETRDNFRGVPGTLHRKMTGRPQHKANLCRVCVRRMRSSRRGSGNACRLERWFDRVNTDGSTDNVLRGDGGGGRLRARNRRGRGKLPPPCFAGAPPRASRAPQRKQRAGPLGGTIRPNGGSS